MAIFEGGASYNEMRSMPFPELMMLSDEANRINKLRSKK